MGPLIFYDYGSMILHFNSHLCFSFLFCLPLTSYILIFLPSPLNSRSFFFLFPPPPHVLHTLLLPSSIMSLIAFSPPPPHFLQFSLLDIPSLLSFPCSLLSFSSSPGILHFTVILHLFLHYIRLPFSLLHSIVPPSLPYPLFFLLKLLLHYLFPRLTTLASPSFLPPP